MGRERDVRQLRTLIEDVDSEVTIRHTYMVLHTHFMYCTHISFNFRASRWQRLGCCAMAYLFDVRKSAHIDAASATFCHKHCVYVARSNTK